MADCLFCKIIAGDVPSQQVYTCDTVLAFADIHPKAPTHVLVVPKRHFATLGDIPTDDTIMNDITKAIQHIVADQGIAESGYRVIVNTGADAGQEVDHVHWHILGGKPMGPMVCE